MVGFRFTLVSDTAIESFAFGREGYAGCDLGEKNGATMGPGLLWWIDEAGVLKLGDERSKPWISLKKVGHVGRTVAVEERGRQVVFTREVIPQGDDMPVIKVR